MFDIAEYKRICNIDSVKFDYYRRFGDGYGNGDGGGRGFGSGFVNGNGSGSSFKDSERIIFQR